MKYKKGEVWEISGRKGKQTIKLLEDVNDTEDTFFRAKILDGKCDFISVEYGAAQVRNGLGTKGTVMQYRTSLVCFEKRVKT